MNTTSKKNEYELAMQRGRESMAGSPALEPLRKRATRKALVVLDAMGLAAYFCGSPMGKPWVTLLGLIVFAGVGVLIRFGTRGVADHPDHALDEREIQVRNHAYLLSYRALSALVVLLAVFTIFANAFGGGINVAWTMQSLLTLVFVSVVIPSWVVAWTEGEE